MHLGMFHKQPRDGGSFFTGGKNVTQPCLFPFSREAFSVLGYKCCLFPGLRFSDSPKSNAVV